MAAPSTMCVSVQSIAGALLALEVKCPGRTADLKKRIAEVWQVPPTFQHLVVGTRIIGDSEQLLPYCRGDAAKLSVTMVVSFERAIQYVRNAACPKKQIMALKAIAELASRGNDAAITTMISCLEEEHVLVRCAAVHVLRKLVEEGNRRAITAVSARLSDPDACVRCIAIEALTDAIRGGDESVIALITARVKDPVASVRRAVVQTLSTVAESDGGVAIVLTLLGHADACVRCVALEALCKAVEAGDPRAVVAVSSHLEDPDACVRCVAVDVLSRTIKAGACASAVCARLGDPHLGVRCAAMEALRKMERRTEGTIAAVIMYGCLLKTHGGEGTRSCVAGDDGAPRAARPP